MLVQLIIIDTEWSVVEAEKVLETYRCGSYYKCGLWVGPLALQMEGVREEVGYSMPLYLKVCYRYGKTGK